MAGIRNVVVVLAVILLTVYALSVRDYLAAQQQQQQQRTGDGTQQQRQQQRSRAVSLASCNSTRLDFSRVHRISWNPRAYHYKGFLTDEECDHWVAKAKQMGLQRSKVAAVDTDTLSEVRTSSGIFMPGAVDPLLASVEERISRWTRLPVEHGEAFYFLQYEVNQQYQPHHDTFDPTQPGMDRYLGASGQRYATVVIYLGTPEEGGETTFPRINAAVPAVKGDAILFWSLHPDLQLNPNAMHGSNKVVRGTKYAAAKWIRVNPTYRGA